MDDLFELEYAKLNTEQRKAVDTIDGPVMVIAGPGTGKTQILTLRIANIIRKTDTLPENILALTFTEAAAHNMRKRLARIIGNAAYRVRISTFHSFCNDVIKKYPEDFPRIIGSKSITEVDQVEIIQTIIDKTQYVLLKPFGDHFLYVRDIVSSINELKREGVDPTLFREMSERAMHDFKQIPDLYHEKGVHKGKMKGDYQKLERKILKNQELSHIYEEYSTVLTSDKKYDYNDMILEVLTVLRNNQSLLQMLQEEHQYVLIDEHQDTNNAQNKIVELIMSYHDTPNLFVVGDEKQAIFRFQGASEENFEYFKHQYKNVVLIFLSKNYRSTQTILDTAHRLITGSVSLKKESEHLEQPIRIAALPTAAIERYFVAYDIKQKISSGVEPSEIAILYRNNKDAFLFAHDLERFGVPFIIESDQDLFSQRDVLRFITVLRAIAEYGNDEAVIPLLHISFFGIDPLDIYKIIRNVHDTREYSVYDSISTEKYLRSLKLATQDAVLTIGRKLKEWVILSRNSDLLALFERVLRDAGFIEDIIGATDATDRFAALSALFDQMKQLIDKKSDATISDFFVYLDVVKKHNLFLKRPFSRGAKGKVRLMTVHKSKGLEFEYVYIVRTIHGNFGGKIDRDRLPLLDQVYLSAQRAISRDIESDILSDERRLFYVAITRAKHDVTITYAHEDDDKRETLPSVFISEIKSELLNIVDTAEVAAAYDADPTFQFREVAPIAQATRESEEIFVRELFDRHGLSPTALNNYIECPWKYFYQNLIRIPSAPTLHQAYGIAVHRALQDLFSVLKEDEKDKGYLLAAFEHSLNEQTLKASDRVMLLEKGTKALSGWFDTYHDSWNINVLTEFRINGIMLAEGVKITGVLDKVEFIDDTIVNVVDYKTGKPKTRNELEAKTKNADGNYYRQLVFYKLLLNHFMDGKYSMQSGMIDFIEPTDAGVYRREVFIIDDNETHELKKTIMRVASEIISLSFWDTTCGKKDCEFCALRKLTQK